MPPDLQTLVTDITAVVSMPEVYHRLEEAINHPHMSLEEVGGIIAADADLSARLLRIANSAFFNFPGRIDTIGRAVTVIGTQQLRDLVLATSVIRMFEGIPVGMVSMRGFWEHSIACGIVARTIAIYRREANTERFYVAGLLHDIGRLVLLLRLPDEMSGLLKEAGEGDLLLHEREQQVLGYDHAAVGSALLERWQIPESLREPVAWHHAPMRARRYPMEAGAVHVADVIVHGLRIGGTGEQTVPPMDPDAWERLEIPTDALAGIVQRSEQQHKEAVDLFLGGVH
jgi:HD-like signal output (HDOD) protein